MNTDSTSNKGQIKNKVLVEEKQLTTGGGLTARYSGTVYGTMLWQNLLNYMAHMYLSSS
jgi:hypothetical protein